MVAIGSLDRGGSEKQLTEFLVRMPRERFEPTVVAIGDDTAQDGRNARRLRAVKIPIVWLPRSRAPLPMRALQTAGHYRRALSTLRPDLVYAWLDEAGAYLAPLCRVGRIPCLVARRNIFGSRTERRHRKLGQAIRFAERSATMVTVNSSAVAEAAVARGHCPSHIRLAPNGHEYQPPLPMPEAPPVVFGYVAHFRSVKGHGRLMDALERMPAGGWRVDLAGRGELRGEIEKRVHEAGLADRVHFVGMIDDERAFWRERHVAMLLSDAEGLPNALLEAGYAGRPVIATRTGGIPEVVGEGGGILVALDDPPAVAAAMSRLVHDARSREEMGAAIWRHVSANYSIERMLSAHLEAIEEVYEGHTR
jgi:glycosyltransferase involved in cell wall biosynthesis